jgi:hypothetical protein
MAYKNGANALEVQKIKKMFAAGHSIPEISATIKIEQASVQQLIHSYGFTDPDGNSAESAREEIEEPVKKVKKKATKKAETED